MEQWDNKQALDFLAYNAKIMVPKDAQLNEKWKVCFRFLRDLFIWQCISFFDMHVPTFFFSPSIPPPTFFLLSLALPQRVDGKMLVAVTVPDQWQKQLDISGIEAQAIVDAVKNYVQTEESGKADVIAYTSLINAYVKANRFDDAFKVYDDMIRANIKPDEITFRGR